MGNARWFLAFFISFFIPSSIYASDEKIRIKIQGSTTVNPVVAEAAEHFRKKGWTILVDTQGGSSGGISALGEGLVDIAMSSKPISAKDRKRFPGINFQEHTIGFDGVAIVISKPLFNRGITSLTRNQIKQIYESKVKNWSQLGGPNKKVVFFNKEPGRGTWEVFAKYLYGKTSKAPKVFHPEVGANEEARSKVAAHSSAMTQLSASWVKPGGSVRYVGIRKPNGKTVFPSPKNIKNGSYPIRRALLLVTNGEPKGPIKELIQHLKSKDGQALVARFGYLPME